MRQSIAPKTEVTTKPWIATACGLAMNRVRVTAKCLVLPLVRPGLALQRCGATHYAARRSARK